MGEKIKDIGKFRLNDREYLIELNKPLSKGGSRMIHLQNNSFRYALTEKNFLKMVGSLVKAKYQLKNMKGNKNYERSE